MPIVRFLESHELPSILPLIEQLNPNVTPTVLRARFESIVERNYRCVGAFIDDQLVGIAGVWTGTRFWCGDYADIDNVVVHPDYRSHKIGAQLMQWIEQWATSQSITTLVLDAYVTNSQAAKFYLREGFEIVGFHYVKKL